MSIKISLVTGGAGFIGSHLIEELLGLEHMVVVVDNFYTGKRENIPISPKVKVLHGDLTDHVLIKSLFMQYKFDYIFHLAAIASVQESISDPYNTHLINNNVTLMLLEEANKQKSLKRFIFASSAAVYGDDRALPKSENSFIKPISPYAIDKFSSEQYVLAYNRIFGMPTTALRYFNVYGPRQNPRSQYSGVLSILTNKFLEANYNTINFEIFGDGEQTRDFVYVKDVIQANLISAFNREAIGRVFNVGTGISISLNKIIDIYEDITGIKVNKKYKESREGDILHSRANITSLKKIGFENNYTIEKGLEEYWIEEYNNANDLISVKK